MALTDDEKVMLAIGAATRLHLPMGDRFLWRPWADRVRGLCSDLELFSRMSLTPDMTEFDMHMRIKAKVLGINKLSRQDAAEAGIEIRDGRPMRGEHLKLVP